MSNWGLRGQIVRTKAMRKNEQTKKIAKCALGPMCLELLGVIRRVSCHQNCGVEL